MTPMIDRTMINGKGMVESLRKSSSSSKVDERNRIDGIMTVLMLLSPVKLVSRCGEASICVARLVLLLPSVYICVEVCFRRVEMF